MAKPLNTLLSARRGSDTAWHGAAFVVEALLLLLFLAFALAVFMQLFGAAHVRGLEERSLTAAVTLAANDAEEFAAMPQAGSRTTAFDDKGAALEDATGGEYAVAREVTSENTAEGVLYRAVITVTRDDEEVYRLESARYVSNDSTDGGRAATGAEGGEGA